MGKSCYHSKKMYLGGQYYGVTHPNMHTVAQNRDRFTINNLFHCCKAVTFTHPLVYEFLCVPF